jgi:acetyl-CoA synthetase
LGAIYVPLFTAFRGEGLRLRLADSGSSVVVTDAENRRHLGEVEQRLGSIHVLVVGGGAAADDHDFERLVERADAAVGVARTTLDEPSTLMYTSGTMGPPKGCVLPHRAILNLWPYVKACLALTPGELLFSTADPGWSFGLFTTGLAPLTMAGSRLLYEGPFDAAGWWDTAREHSVRHLASAPSGYRQLMAAGPEVVGSPRPPLRAATSAGEPLDPPIIEWFERELAVTIHDSYGLTELGMVIANQRTPGTPAPAPGSMGLPLPGFEVRLLDDRGDEARAGEVGRVAVRDNGYLLGSGYWGRDVEWQERLVDGWWVTEDLARRDERGRYWYVSRRDDVIVSSGYNIGPFEVETALLEHPLVQDAAVVGEADPANGTLVVAHVVLVGPPPPDLDDELRRWVRDRVGRHAAPRRVQVHESLPRTESGKVRRQALRRPPAN